ncbi:collagen alpha-1(XVII) chain [Platysternon megacephalum]|uniref:Collagen alpha-1(XVII) chain n=1 Tax=Platysternon megacephalum TaxID=55544 RepID=A0A4D9EJR7_9SAUR|nr:collagen alpha-1(XVII) chain [Platysternon megacephalum]
MMGKGLDFLKVLGRPLSVGMLLRAHYMNVAVCGGLYHIPPGNIQVEMWGYPLMVCCGGSGEGWGRSVVPKKCWVQSALGFPTCLLRVVADTAIGKQGDINLRLVLKSRAQ